MRNIDKQRLRPYFAALWITAAATLARLSLAPVLGRNFPLLMYWPSIEFIAYRYGFGPALFAIPVSLLVGRVLFIQPLTPFFDLSRGEWAAAALFVIFSGSLAKLMDILHNARALAEQRLEQLRTEGEARRKERYWAESVLASIGDGVIAADTNGAVTYMNDVAENLTGWSRTEAVKQPLSEVFYTIEQPPYTVLSATYGRAIPIEHSESTIRNRESRELGVVRVFRDVTERQKAHEALEATKSRLHESLRAAGAAAWEWNTATGELMCSHEFQEMTGAQGDRCLSFEDWMGSAGDADRRMLRTELEAAAGRALEVHLEYRTDREGEIRWVAVMGRATGAGRMAGIVKDVTERRRLEEKLRDAAKQESLAMLSGGIAHDFNNLLTSVLGYASLLREELPAGSPMAEYALNIEAASQRAAHLTRQMLAYAGEGSFAVERLDLSACVRGTLAELREELAPNIRVEVSLEKDLPCVSADLRQLSQVVSNIVTNAAEAIGEAEGRIEISTRAVDLDEGSDEIGCGRYAVFQVRDSGPGMDDETKAKIFDPFFTTKFTGRGLGLAAVSGIVRGHGGAIRVESAPGEGALFQTFWPVEQESGPRCAMS